MAEKNYTEYSIADFCFLANITRIGLAEILNITNRQQVANIERSPDFNFTVLYYPKNHGIKIKRTRKMLDEKIVYSGSVKLFSKKMSENIIKLKQKLEDFQ